MKNRSFHFYLSTDEAEALLEILSDVQIGPQDATHVGQLNARARCATILEYRLAIDLAEEKERESRA